MQLKNGPPKTLLEQQNVGVQFHDKPKDGAGASTDVLMNEHAPAEDCYSQFLRRMQAKLDAANYNNSQRGCVSLHALMPNTYPSTQVQ